MPSYGSSHFGLLGSAEKQQTDSRILGVDTWFESNIYYVETVSFWMDVKQVFKVDVLSVFCW